MTYVVIGATGLLGRHVSQLLASRRLPRVLFGHSAASGNGHVSRIDIRDPHAVESAIWRAAPRVVINTAHDRTDWRTTAVGPANLARVCERHGVRLVHISSDTVFSGDEPSYDESSTPDPRTPHGAAKAAAETAVAMFDNTAIIRTSWLVGDGTTPLEPAGDRTADDESPSEKAAARAGAPVGNGLSAAGRVGGRTPGSLGERLSSFEEFVRGVASGDTDGILYLDDIAMPLHVADLAGAVLEIAQQRFRGTIHVAGPEPMSRHRLATAYAEWAGMDPGSLPRGRRYGDDGPVAVKLDSSMARSILQTRIRAIDEVYCAGDA